MKIAVIGPQNTGKTTFIMDCVQKFPTYSFLEKTYRDVIKEKNLPINRETNAHSQGLIRDVLIEQMETLKTNMLMDRSSIDNYVYTVAGHKLGNIEKAFVDETYKKMLASLKHIDVFLFIPSALSVKLENDSLRDVQPAYVDTINGIFIQILLDIQKECPIRVEVISGTRSERVAQVGKIIA